MKKKTKTKKQRIRQIKVNYFKSTVRLISFHNGLFDFFFFFFLTPECRLPGKRRDSSVDRIFNSIYLGNRREKRKWQGWIDLKRKRIVFTLASLRTRRSRARLHQRQRRVLRRLKVMWQIKVKESHICKLSEISLDCSRRRYCLYTRGFINIVAVGELCVPVKKILATPLY